MSPGSQVFREFVNDLSNWISVFKNVYHNLFSLDEGRVQKHRKNCETALFKVRIVENVFKRKEVCQVGRSGR